MFIVYTEDSKRSILHKTASMWSATELYSKHSEIIIYCNLHNMLILL